MSYTIRFDDGALLTKEQLGLPELIPFERRYGVLWIYQGPDHDRLFNKDNYIWRMDYDCFIECDDAGLKYYLARAAHLITCYLQGSTVPRLNWHRAQEEMNALSRRV